MYDPIPEPVVTRTVRQNMGDDTIDGDATLPDVHWRFRDLLKDESDNRTRGETNPMPLVGPGRGFVVSQRVADSAVIGLKS